MIANTANRFGWHDNGRSPDYEYHIQGAYHSNTSGSSSNAWLFIIDCQ